MCVQERLSEMDLRIIDIYVGRAAGIDPPGGMWSLPMPLDDERARRLGEVLEHTDEPYGTDPGEIVAVGALLSLHSLVNGAQQDLLEAHLAAAERSLQRLERRWHAMRASATDDEIAGALVRVECQGSHAAGVTGREWSAVVRDVTGAVSDWRGGSMAELDALLAERGRELREQIAALRDGDWITIERERLLGMLAWGSLYRSTLVSVARHAQADAAADLGDWLAYALYRIDQPRIAAALHPVGSPAGRIGSLLRLIADDIADDDDLGIVLEDAIADLVSDGATATLARAYGARLTGARTRERAQSGYRVRQEGMDSPLTYQQWQESIRAQLATDPEDVAPPAWGAARAALTTPPAHAADIVEPEALGHLITRADSDPAFRGWSAFLEADPYLPDAIMPYLVFTIGASIDGVPTTASAVVPLGGAVVRARTPDDVRALLVERMDDLDLPRARRETVARAQREAVARAAAGAITSTIDPPHQTTDRWVTRADHDTLIGLEPCPHTDGEWELASDHLPRWHPARRHPDAQAWTCNACNAVRAVVPRHRIVGARITDAARYAAAERLYRGIAHSDRRLTLERMQCDDGLVRLTPMGAVIAIDPPGTGASPQDIASMLFD